jgi:hypothetical protein
MLMTQIAYIFILLSTLSATVKSSSILKSIEGDFENGDPKLLKITQDSWNLEKYMGMFNSAHLPSTKRTQSWNKNSLFNLESTRDPLHSRRNLAPCPSYSNCTLCNGETG